MRRVLVPFALLAALAAGCGSAAGAGDGAAAGDALARAAVASAAADSVRFDVELSADVRGGAAAGTYAVRATGAVAREAGEGRADVDVRVSAGGLTLVGSVRYTGGDTLYVQAPLLLGPRWRSVEIDGRRGDHHGPRLDPAGTMRFLDRLHPDRWLTGVSVSRDGDTQTVEADLDVRGAADDLLGALTAELDARGAGPDAAARLNDEFDEYVPQVDRAVRRAHGTLVVDAGSGLPQRLAADVSVDVPPEHRAAGGPDGLDVRLRATFSGWDEPVAVDAPEDARPLDPGDLHGGLLPALPGL